MIIGIDIGGTKITGIVWNGKKIVDELTIVTPKNLLLLEKSLLKLVDFLSAGKKINKIGVGMAGLVDPQAGIIKYSPNIKFVKNFNLVRFFQLNGFKQVKINNDANCFARGEMILGQGKKFKNFLVLTLGTGIGGGIVINKQIYRGTNNAGAELGHMVLKNGFWETEFRKARNKKQHKQVGRLLGLALANMNNIFTPDAIIIGGGYGQGHWREYLPQAKQVLNKYLFDKTHKTQLIISKLKNAGALGAALL